jgi:hypothetical protein
MVEIKSPNSERIEKRKNEDIGPDESKKLKRNNRNDKN